ncbi:hypothetical protein WJX72_000326 [[Myrmecia] bisecta]|uniref:Uncharacterized protein n=1 Tax=[Myrmecia] bisecta TaxID=41462 RepID=A0AAW1PTP3_9CHLO
MAQIKLRCTDSISQLLRQAADLPNTNQDLQDALRLALHDQTVQWGVLKQACAAIRQHQPDGKQAGPWLHRACQGAALDLQAPVRREKSPELVQRLAKLQRDLDQQRYDRMVLDVTEEERKAQAASEGGLNTYKEQMSFGLHVIVMMGTFYALGHVAALGLSSKPAHHAVGGLAGMTCAMLLETTLLIIRTNFPYELRSQRKQRQPVAASPEEPKKER